VDELFRIYSVGYAASFFIQYEVKRLVEE